MSTKTGWAHLDITKDKCELVECGVLNQIPIPKGIEYPSNYLAWSELCFLAILEIVEKVQPEFIVIEETAKGSRDSFIQKILEWIHYRMAQQLSAEMAGSCIKGYRYFLTEEWRRIAGCQQSKEEKRNNAKRSRLKKKLEKGATVIKDAEGKRLGKIGKKHVNVRRCNEVFGTNFILKQEDQADAALLGYAYYLEFKNGK